MSLQDVMTPVETSSNTATLPPEGNVPLGDGPVPAAPEGSKDAPKELESSRFAALAKKEARLVKEQQALKAKLQEIEAKEKELSQKLTPFQEFEVLRSKDPVAALRGLGFSETDIFNWLANGGEAKELTPQELAEQAAQKKIEDWEKRKNEDEKKAQEKRNQDVLANFRVSLGNFLSKNAEKYEACADYGDVAVDAAFRLIKQVAKDTETNPDGPEILSLEDAFQVVEDYYEGEYQRMGNYKKFKKTQEAPLAPPDAPKPTAPEAQSVSRGTKTLTNAASPTIASVSNVKRRESVEQKKERLANMLRSGNVVLTK